MNSRLIEFPGGEQMKSFLHKVLAPPFYGYVRGDELYIPTKKEIFQQFFQRYNIFRSRKNWLTFTSWTFTFLLIIPFFIFFIKYFSFPLLIIGLIYSMIGLGTHGTIYLHRFCSHRAYKVKNNFILFIIKNLSIKIIPEEIYAISHLVHHRLSERPGDPYNVHGGWLYCFLADGIHQPIATDLGPKNYASLSRFMQTAGMGVNTFEQYQKYGSVSRPVPFVLSYLLNWSFWYGVFFLLGGHALSTAIFGLSAVWAFGVRTFNYDGHGRGKNQQQEGIDFNKSDLSINQVWAGFVSGEWHNNHHLYPNGARAGFLPYQLDLAWLFIHFCYLIGAVTKYNDPKKTFLKDHFYPYIKKVNCSQAAALKEMPL